MITIADATIEKIYKPVIEGETNKQKPLVICGSCGAQELTVDENSTECPHCDDYIY